MSRFIRLTKDGRERLTALDTVQYVRGVTQYEAGESNETAVYVSWSEDPIYVQDTYDQVVHMLHVAEALI